MCTIRFAFALPRTRKQLLSTGLVLSMLGGACGSGQTEQTSDTSATSPPVAASAPTAEATTTTTAVTTTAVATTTIVEATATTGETSTWVSDLDEIDARVRNLHDDPFSVVSEAEWSARIAELKESFPGADRDERIVGMASLAGLLDTHTQFWSPDQTMYEVLLYRFSDGVFVIAASDPSMIGLKLESVNGTSAVDLEALMQPLIPADNEGAYLNATYLMSYVEYLHGLGVIDDPTKPGFVFSTADGSEVTVELGISGADAFFDAQHALGSMVGDQNEAIQRRAEPIWWRIDEPTGAFLLALNEHSSEGQAEAIAAIADALDTGAADHVVVDMRYLRGGDGSQLVPVVQALENDPRINNPGSLTVLIGRENESAATVIAAALDAGTSAKFVGEMTPARADNFLCPCGEDPLPESGYVFSVPESRSGTGDARLAIEPDVPVLLSSVDFFAGRDPALDTALAG